MENSNVIKFDGELNKGKYVGITYSGELFKNDSASCYIVFGYGDNWEHTTEQGMNKTDDGFVAQIKLLNYDKFNFCFRNEVYSWDNNNSQNFSSPIVEIEETPSFVLEQSQVIEILNKIVANDISKIESNRIADFEASLERFAPVSLEESIGAISLESELAADLNNVLAETETPVEEKEFNMAEVIDEVLAPIIEAEGQEEASIFEEYTEDIEDVKDNAEDSINSVVDDVVSSIYEKAEIEEDTVEETPEVVENIVEDTEEESLIAVSPRALSSAYMFKKRIKLAFYKIFYAIPRMLKSFYGEANSDK